MKCASSQQYIKDTVQMSSTVLNQKLWSSAFEAGWTGAQRTKDTRYWHKSSTNRFFATKKGAKAYNNEP